MRTRMFSRSVSVVALAAGIATAGSTPLHAVIVDLVLNTSGTANSGFFTRTDNHSTGTGVIDPFVRLSSNEDVMDGYNAGARPVMPEVNSSPTFTRDIQLSQIPIVVNPTGAPSGSYYEFLLDINQTGTDPILSLHGIELWTRSTALTTANTYTALSLSGAVKRWDLDVGPNGDSWIQMDYRLNEGSGSGDMFAYIPVFEGVPTNHYLYFYSAFGIPDNNNDGFEEWAVRTLTPVRTPDGGTTAILLGSVLLGLAFIQRRLFC